MRKGIMKKAFALSLSAIMMLSMTACGGNSTDKDTTKEGDSAKTDSSVTLDQIKLGEDYTDLKADLKF